MRCNKTSEEKNDQQIEIIEIHRSVLVEPFLQRLKYRDIFITNFVCSNNSALYGRIIPRKEWFLGLKIKKTNEVCL